MTRSKLILLIVVIGVGWFIWQRSGSYDYTNFPPTATGPWIAFGDSLTEGFGASEGHDYPTVLAQRLGIKIVNFGRSGETSAEGLKRVEQAAQVHPRVVLLCMGGNDILQKLPREQMFNNLSALVDRFHQEGSFVVLIGVRSASLWDKNAKLFRAFARKKQVFYVEDMLKGVFAKPVYMSDAVHPNDEGYRFIAERLEEELAPVLDHLKAAQ